jgi:hypothetical protein
VPTVAPAIEAAAMAIDSSFVASAVGGERNLTYTCGFDCTRVQCSPRSSRAAGLTLFPRYTPVGAAVGLTGVVATPAVVAVVEAAANGDVPAAAEVVAAKTSSPSRPNCGQHRTLIASLLRNLPSRQRGIPAQLLPQK